MKTKLIIITLLALAVGGACPSDVDNDGTVGIQDFLQLLGDWGPCERAQVVAVGAYHRTVLQVWSDNTILYRREIPFFYPCDKCSETFPPFGEWLILDSPPATAAPVGFVRVDADARPVVANQPKSSAETLLHVVVAQRAHVGAVLHTHSTWSTLISDLYFDDGGLKIEGYEMLKGLADVTTHECSVRVPIFDNTQDIPLLAEQVRQQLDGSKGSIHHGYLIRRHGLYTWGRDLDEARRHIEIFEFLFECVARRLILTGAVPVSSTNAQFHSTER